MNSDDLDNYSRTKGGSSYRGFIDYPYEKGGIQKTIEIAQWHNPRIFIDDILGENETKQFTSIMIIGSPGTGKTTLATFIGHEIHTRDPSYLVVHLGRDELLRFDTLIDELPNRNIILIFDDVSLVFKHIKDPTKRTKILTTLTEARHPKFENSDRRVIVIANVHYVNAIEKMWRSQGGWKFYTDLNNEEMQNFNHMTKGKFTKRAENFARITTEQFRKKKFTVKLTSKLDKDYFINDPFRFVMCYDNSELRFFLCPAKSCNYCDRRKNRHSKTAATPDEIITMAEKYYKKDGIAGLKLALLLAGRTEQYRNNTIYAFNTAKEILATFDINLEELALKLRERAQIKGSRLYTIHKKRTDFMGDLAKIRSGEEINTQLDPQEPEAEEPEELTEQEKQEAQAAIDELLKERGLDFVPDTKDDPRPF